MGAGLNAGSFAGNFGSAFTDVLLGHRKEQAERKDKEFTLLFQPALEQAFQSGDFSLPEKLITQYHPNLAKGLQKNSPFGQLGPLLQAHNAQAQPGQVQTNQPAGVSGGTLGSLPQSAQPEGVTGGTVGSIPATQRMPVGTGNLGMGPGADAGSGNLGMGLGTDAGSGNLGGVQAPSPIQQSSQSTFFGMPMMTPTQRAEQQAQMATVVDRVGFMERYARAKQAFPNDPDKQADYALYGTRPPERASAEPYAAIDGVDGDGHPVSAVFDQHRGLYVDQITKEPIVGFHKTATSSRAESEFDQYLATYAKDKNKPPEALSGPERLDARQKFAEAGSTKEATTSNIDPEALARLSIRNPAVLQGLTDSKVRAAVQTVIAKDPVLSAQYETSRLAPVRAQADTVIKAIDDLLVTKDAKGNPLPDNAIALRPGTETLYGKSRVFGTLGWVPGSDAANAQAALDQITGQLVLNTLAEMKAQSRTGATGFGQLNINELAVIENATSQLKAGLSEEKALSLLKDLRAKFVKVGLPSAAESAPLVSTGNKTGAAPATITLDTPIFIGADGKPSLGGGR